MRGRSGRARVGRLATMVGVAAVGMAAAWVPRGHAQTAPPPGTVQTPPATEEPGGGDLKRRLRDIKDQPSDQVKDVPLQDPGTRIPPPRDVTTAVPERQAPARQAREDDPTTLPELAGEQRRALFATAGYQRRFAELQRCREEVALVRKARLAAVRAGEVQLRWMVAADGAVQGVQVVATRSTDPDVMACVHRKVESWRIDPPPNMPYRTSHQLTLAPP
jgi:hypothetical protein